MTEKKLHQVKVILQTHDGSQASIVVKSVCLDDPEEGFKLAKKLRDDIASGLEISMGAQLVHVVGQTGEPLGVSMLEALRGIGIVGFNVGIVSMPMRTSELLTPSKGGLVLLK